MVNNPGDLTFEATEVEQPSLEEAYLAFMSKRGKLEGARQDEEHSAPEATDEKKGRKRRKRKKDKE